MRICALILMGSLPTTRVVVESVLVVLLLVALLLLLLKWREAAMLKKEVLELRDTMRMMRYEESNLARMLHKANEPFIPMPADALGEAVEEDRVEAFEIPEVSETSDTSDTSQPEIAKESCTETFVVKPVEVSAEIPVEKTVETPVEAPTGIPVEAPTEVSVEAKDIPSHGKQAINERRPAIPNDLFAAWFAENEADTFAENELDTEEDSVVADAAAPVPSGAVAVVAEEVEKTVAPLAVAEQSVDTMPVEEEMVAPNEEETLPVGTVASGELNKDDERFCRKLERIVNTRLRNPNLNIDIIAAQFGVGRTNFYRKVRELTGMSPNDYLRKCRMERAAELLCSSDIAVNDVCAQVGMPDAQYFSRVFKAYFGISPSVYRENHNQ